MKKVFFIGGILLALVGLALIQPQEELSDQVRIGVSDDMSGFVLDYMVGDGKNQGLEAYFIKDC